MCLFGSQTFVPVSSVSTESENNIILLDAGLRMDRLLALDSKDVEDGKCCVGQKKNTKTPNPASGNRCETGYLSRNTLKPRRKGNRDVEQLSLVDHISTNTTLLSQLKSQLYIFEDNEAAITDDHQRQKSIHETRVKNPQSCA